MEPGRAEKCLDSTAEAQSTLDVRNSSVQPFFLFGAILTKYGNTRLAVHMEETGQGCSAVGHMASGC